METFKLNELLKLEYRFFFHNTTIVLIYVFFIFYLFGILYSTGIDGGWVFLDAFREEYLDEFIKDSLLIINFVDISLVIFTGIIMQSQTHQNLALKKINVFFSNIFFQLGVLLLYTTVLSLMFLVILNIITPFNISGTKLLFCFKWLILKGIFYLILINTLLIIFQHILVGLLPIALMWFMEMNANIYIIESNETLKDIYKWVPSIIYSNNQFIVIQDYVFYGLVTIGSLLFSLTIYLRRDIL